MFARIGVALLFTLSIARADEPDGGAPADGGALADGGAPAVAQTPGDALKRARDEFDFGKYESVVVGLRPIVEALELTRELPEKADRLEALRVYGIACTLTGRRTAAEGAFLLLLREEPSTRLDPALVRPEAVAFFEEVRGRHRAELLAAYRKNRRPYYWALDLDPARRTAAESPVEEGDRLRRRRARAPGDEHHDRRAARTLSRRHAQLRWSYRRFRAAPRCELG